MSKLLMTRTAIAGLLIAALAIAGCTNTAPGGSTTSGALSMSVTPSVADSPDQPTPEPSPTVSSAASSGSPSSDGLDTSTRSAASAQSSENLSPQEAADRAAIEAQWIKFWVVYDEIVRTPVAQRKERLQSVAVSPALDEVLEAANQADADGIDNYGTWSHRLSWETPVAGQTTAVISDCQDQSQTGTIDVASGKTLTVGKSRSHMRGEFVKTPNGIWLLRQVYFIVDRPC